MSGRPSRLLTILLAASATTLAAQRSPRDYPQWRGRDREGSASAFVEPKSWPDHLTRRWNVEVGDGYATPIVVGDLVFAFTRRDGNEVMAALDAATGKERWKTAYPAPYTLISAAAAHGMGPKATPLSAGRLLFLLNENGELIVARGTRSGLEFVKQYVVSESATWAQPAISGNRVFVKDVSSLTLWTVN